jgi:hypothetical protein
MHMALQQCAQESIVTRASSLFKGFRSDASQHDAAPLASPQGLAVVKGIDMHQITRSVNTSKSAPLH